MLLHNFAVLLVGQTSVVVDDDDDDDENYYFVDHDCENY
jgi:hypothetical protein